VREPVVVYDGKILDGRNRYLMARDLGLPFPVRDFEGDDAAALAFVLSTNLHRRHLTESQRAMVATKVANLSHGGNRRAVQGANLPLETAPAQMSVAQAADMLNVSERSVKTARKVVEETPPEVSRAVETGHVSVHLAAQVAELPEEAQAEVAAAPPEKMREVAREEVKKAHVAHNSGNNEWYTPPDILDAARAVLGGFDLDPASSEVANRTVSAARIFTAEDDGLAQEWPVGRIWCNPPYAQPLIGDFAKRIAKEVRRGSSAIVLVNNATETQWFQTLAQVATAICFPQGRVKFLDPQGNASGAPLQGQAIIYAGQDVDAFCATFASFGFVVRHG
jgi:phage N-6-adenine-methyltransferase